MLFIQLKRIAHLLHESREQGITQEKKKKKKREREKEEVEKQSKIRDKQTREEKIIKKIADREKENKLKKLHTKKRPFIKPTSRTLRSRFRASTNNNGMIKTRPNLGAPMHKVINACLAVYSVYSCSRCFLFLFFGCMLFKNKINYEPLEE